MRRRLYVNNLSTVLATAQSRLDLINWALDPNHLIDTFEYYDLRSVLGSSSSNNYAIGNTASANTLGNFIAQARTAGIPNHVAVMGGFNENVNNTIAETQMVNAPYGNKIINSYNAFHSYNPTKCFIGANSGLNLELEYWWNHTNLNGNGQPYTNGITAYGFQKWLATGNVTDEVLGNFFVWYSIMASYNRWIQWVKANPGAGIAPISENYIGFFNPTGYETFEANTIMVKMFQGLKKLGTINVHAYRAPTSNSQSLASYAQRVWGYVQTRVGLLGQACAATYGPASKVSLSLIYSFEGDFSGPWFSANPTVTIDAFHNAVLACYNAATFAGKANVDIAGYTLFKQTLVRAIRP